MPISFAGDVVPIFSLCSGCHAGAGQGGFSLDSGDVNTLYYEVAQEPSTAANPSPRVDTTTPENSLVLTKPSGVSHGGGLISGFDLSGMHQHYDTILQWIQEGANNN